jgi:heme-degrading monooxygenase HmoA
MDRNPAKDANRKAKREMQKAIGKVIDQKKEEPIGTKAAEKGVAADLNEAAHKDTQKLRTQKRGARAADAFENTESVRARIRTGKEFVTQITVVESEPEKQAEALSMMTERARFMARQPGFISISVHRSFDGRRIVNYIQWQSRELLQAAHESPEFRKDWTHFDELTEDIDPHLYEVVHAMDSDPAGHRPLAAR